MFYRRELPRLSRPSRGWARTSCPFHQGQNKTAFSVNLKTGAFYCFNCGVKGGDVLDFIRLRDRLSFKQAAQSLGAWADEPMDWNQARKLRREREQREADRVATIEADRRRRIEARDWLLTLRNCQELAGRRLGEINRGSVEKYAGEAEDCWSVMAGYEDWVREADRDYCAVAGIEFHE